MRRFIETQARSHLRLRAGVGADSSRVEAGIGSTEMETTMTEVLDRAVSGPTVWKGEQLRERTDWIHELTPHDVAEIDDGASRELRPGAAPSRAAGSCDRTHAA